MGTRAARGDVGASWYREPAGQFDAEADGTPDCCPLEHDEQSRSVLSSLPRACARGSRRVRKGGLLKKSSSDAPVSTSIRQS